MKTRIRGLVMFALATAPALALAGCGGKRSDAEMLLLAWTKALNFHLASDIEGGNQYPVKLVDIDPMLRLELLFDDPWGGPIYYRKVTDSQFDLASAGPDGIVGNDDDVVIQDRTLKKASNAWAARPANQFLVAQRAGDRPTGQGGARSASAAGESELDEGFASGDDGSYDAD